MWFSWSDAPRHLNQVMSVTHFFFFFPICACFLYFMYKPFFYLVQMEECGLCCLGSFQAKMECVTPPTLTTENWVIPSASWLVQGDQEEWPCGNLPVRVKHDRDYFSSAQSNSVAWSGEICDLFFCACVCFCFTPRIHPSPRLLSSSLAWYLGHEGTAFSRQRARAYCPLAPPAPRYVIENIQMD